MREIQKNSTSSKITPVKMKVNPLRKSAEETIYAGGHEINITSSLGITALNSPFEDSKHLLKTVDPGFYDSKSANRNTVDQTPWQTIPCRRRLSPRNSMLGDDRYAEARLSGVLRRDKTEVR